MDRHVVPVEAVKDLDRVVELESFNEHVDLNPLDVISFPPGASRRFMNVSKGPKNKESILMFVIGGDAPSAEFTSESMDELEIRGIWPERRARKKK